MANPGGDAFTTINLPGGGTAGGPSAFTEMDPEDAARKKAELEEQARRERERAALAAKQSGSSPEVRTDLKSPDGVQAPSMKAKVDPNSPNQINTAPSAWDRFNAEQSSLYTGADDAEGMRQRALGNASGLYDAGNATFKGRAAALSDYGGVEQFKADAAGSRSEGFRNLGRAGQSLTGMVEEGKYLQQVARGEAGPSVAEAQLARGRDDSIENAMAVAASGPGGRFSPAAQRAATTQAARSQQAFAQGQGELRAQEQATAQQMLGQNLQSQVSGANALAGSAFGQQAYDLQGQQLEAGRADTTADQTFRQRQIDDQTALQLFGQGQGQDALAAGANGQRIQAFSTALAGTQDRMDMQSGNLNEINRIKRDLILGKKGDDGGVGLGEAFGTVLGTAGGAFFGGPAGAVGGGAAGNKLGQALDDL